MTGHLRAALISVALLLAGCAATPAPTPAPASIVVSGTTAMEPLLSALVEAFQRQYPTLTIVREPGNSYQGLQRMLDGEADLGATSVAVADDVWAAPIALDAIALVVHPDNPLENLTLTQVHDVFGGQTWRWRDLGIDLPEDEITVVSREGGSGTRMAFEALVMAHGQAAQDCQPVLAIDRGNEGTDTVRVKACEGTPVTPTAIVAPSSASVIDYVRAHRGAIGYVSRGYAGSGVKVVTVEGLSPAPKNIRDGGYHLAEPFYLVANQEPTGTVRQFVDFCLGPEGQRIVATGYVPVREP